MKLSVLKITLVIFSIFFTACGGKETKKATGTTQSPVSIESKTKKLDIEKAQLTFGFIKLTDMAPLAIAKEKGFFEDEGLFVSIEAQSNWKNILDRVVDGQLDGSHMLAGQPIAASAGFGRQAELVTPFSMDLNGNGITVSNDVWEKMKPNV
ncbi:MAG: ABC transporter substrate-binding protein, partial [Labilibaculum sp.]|nr:ABC transporter substrate-binding protein [Labilibaculum sp.]